MAVDVWLMGKKDWMVEDVLLGLLCCETNDMMSIFLLPVVVHAKEGKEEKVMVASGLQLVK